VEEPYARVIGYEADNEVSLRGQDERVSSSRILRESSVVCWIVCYDFIGIDVVVERSSICRCSVNDLEIVTMKMERMRASIIVW
jgi:hypothetical protein